MLEKFQGAILCISCSFLVLACGQALPSDTAASSASLKSILGHNQIELVGLSRGDVPTHLIGALKVALVDPQAAELFDALAICTAVPISTTLALTASHCAGEGLIFDSQYFARESDLDKLRLLAFGSVLRLRFEGEFLGGSLAELKAKPKIATVLFRDEARDFAVMALSQAHRGAYVDLKRLVSKGQQAEKQRSSFTKLGIVAYPNGVPASVATGCEGFLASGGADLLHDCDSLKGSSGGLVFNHENGLPLALQVKGAGSNSAEFYEKNGHLEEPRDFALQNGCPLVADQDGNEGVERECLLERGYNRALLLTSIYPAIADLLEE